MFYKFQPQRQYRQYVDNFALVSISRKQNVLNSISYSSSTYGVNANYQPHFSTRSLWQDYHHKVNKIQFRRVKFFTTYQLKKPLENKGTRSITSTYLKQKSDQQQSFKGLVINIYMLLKLFYILPQVLRNAMQIKKDLQIELSSKITVYFFGAVIAA